MCFSANASFAAAFILIIVGTSLLKKNHNKKILPFALIPYFFSVQQIFEGMIWLSLPEKTISKSIFLFFAYVFWPIWIPFASWFAEKQEIRKHILGIFLGMGIVLGCLQLFLIPEAEAVIHRSSINYKIMFPIAPLFQLALNLFYVVCTIGPLIFSSLKKMWLIGILVAFAGALILFIDYHWTVSMWCFFAALVSLLFRWIIPNSDT